MAEIIIFDVGHGNCCLVIDEERAVLIDGGSGGTAVRALESCAVSDVHTVVVSHADDDHLGGVLTLLLDSSFKVRQVILNPDPTKATIGWESLRRVAREAQARGTRFVVGVTSDSAIDWGAGEIEIKILAPSVGMALGGVGGRDFAGRTITSNSLSIVVLISQKGQPLALFAGDIDEAGLADLLENNRSPNARLLVFPHHGGLPAGSDGREFAARLCTSVKPRTVFFSIGRGRYGTPREEIVDGVRQGAQDAYILCTQLSENCSKILPSTPQAYLSDLPSGGSATQSCCGGTVTLAIDEESCLSTALRHGHSLFVDDHVDAPLCRRQTPEPLLWEMTNRSAKVESSTKP